MNKKGEKGEKGERGLTTTLDGNAFPTGFIEGPAGKFFLWKKDTVIMMNINCI